ncbi:MAG: hypothetical protein ACLQVI_02110 [Polyangiaceae bacterium]
MPIGDGPNRSSEQVLVAPPTGAVPVLTHVRGTLIVASLKALEQRGHLERYFAALAEEHRAPMRAIIASSWVAEPLGTLHYAACDALHLPPHEVLAIGAEVGDRIRATFLGTILAVAREAGTTPWLFLERLPRLLTRICVGGAVAIYKLGPKEARAEWYGLPGLTIPYFQTAFRGANQAIIEFFCTKAYVSETKALRGGDWAYRASWA